METNLQAIIDEINKNLLPIRIISVFSDNPQAYGIERAKKSGIPTKIIDYHGFRDKTDFHQAMEENIKKLGPDLVVFGWLHENFVGKFLPPISRKNLKYTPIAIAKIQRS